MNEIKVSINRNGLLSKKITFKILNGYNRFYVTEMRKISSSHPWYSRHRCLTVSMNINE